MLLTHKAELDEITSILEDLPRFPHGQQKNQTVKESIARAFAERGWSRETEIPLGTGKTDYCDLVKNRIALEQEYSRFETFFRDFFRFLLLYDQREIDVGVIVTYDETAFRNWGTGVDSYRSARASLQRLIDFLEGRYSTVVRVPLWCIGNRIAHTLDRLQRFKRLNAASAYFNLLLLACRPDIELFSCLRGPFLLR